MTSRYLTTFTVLLAVGCLSACTPAPAETSTASPESGSGHGAIAGAEEIGEPPLGLLSIDEQGNAALLDLLSEQTSEIGGVPAPQSLASDGRYGFVTTGEGVVVIDSGRWSWDHGDHFHYYRAEPALLGKLPGAGPVTVTFGALSTAGTTGVFFTGSGEAVLLDNKSLTAGKIEELFRIETDARSGLVAPVGDGALVTDGDQLVYHDRDGQPVGDSFDCVDAAGAITTRAGLVIGCDDGAVLATWKGSKVSVERIPYPVGIVAERARSFEGRKGRPTVAAVAGSTGFWLLDARERSWVFIPTPRPLTRVSTVDDTEGHVVAIDADGRVVVYLAKTAVMVSSTDPLLSDGGMGSSLVVDGQRAYVNAPAKGVVYEIDFADEARVARSLISPTKPAFFTEVGR